MNNFGAVWLLNHTSEGWYVWVPFLIGAGWWSWETYIFLNHHQSWKKWSQPRFAIPTAVIVFLIMIWMAAAPETSFLILSQEAWVSWLFIAVVAFRLFLAGTFIWKLWYFIQNCIDWEQGVQTRFHRERRAVTSQPSDQK
jgi:hypothetical protein